jgi:diguanylate cyclase
LTASADPLAGVSPFSGFRAAAQGAVEFLHDRIGLDLWLVTQVIDNQQTAIVAHPQGLVLPGMGLPWAEGFCSRMVAGLGPRVASVTAAVPAYAGLSLGPAQRVAAYLGVPLLGADGALYGTLCGFGLRAQPASLGRHLPLAEHTARLLSTVLAQEGAVTRPEELENEWDALTGLLNRRGWERALQSEEVRCRRSGAGATVVALDLDGLESINVTAGHDAGDEFLRSVAAVLTENSRPTDVVARTGGDEFAVLLNRPDPGDQGSAMADAAYLERLQGQLAAGRCIASIGMSGRRADGIGAAWARADAAVYETKLRRRAARPRP